MSTPPTKELKIVKRSCKHVFTPPETAQLNVDFRQSFAALKSVEAEFDSVKASYKAKTTEAESRMESLNATLQAGFDIREQDCVVILDPPKGKKYFYLCEHVVHPVGGLDPILENHQPVITEPLTEADLQQELIEAEAKFEAKDEIQLFEPLAGDSDYGLLVVGRHDGKWFSAIRATIGKNTISERLDGEQPCSKKRSDAVERACKRFYKWLDSVFDRETAKGFKNAVELVKAEHAEREE